MKIFVNNKKNERNKHNLQRAFMFKKIDIFGSQILLRFKGEPTYNTRTGSVVTLLIIGFICFRLFGITSNVFLRINPQVIYNERQVDYPAPFQISSQTFPLAFRMEDPNQFQGNQKVQHEENE
ncbi:hypothetical protein ABPG72_011490 [Tetrahymena utriculariae]